MKAKVKILLLEDEEALGKIYKLRLEMAGYETIWVKTPEEAEEETKNLIPDVVLIDYGIKGSERTGADAIPSIKKSAPEAKIILLTNYNQEHLSLNKENIKIDDFLLKIDTTPSTLIKYLKDPK